MNHSCNLRDMKMFLSFLCGAAVAFGFTSCRRIAKSSTPRLRTAHIPRSARQNRRAQISLWRSYRCDLQAARHEQHWLLGPGRCAELAKSVYLHSRAFQPSGGGEELGRVSSRSGMEKGQVRVGGARTIGGPCRPTTSWIRPAIQRSIDLSRKRNRKQELT